MSALPFQPGELLPGSPYLLGAVRGEGGTAVVYDAEDTSCGRAIVLKVIRPLLLSAGAVTAESMRREARLLVHLHERTEHVVEVITAGLTTGDRQLPYYVMEKLDGHTLEHAFARRRARSELLAIDEAVGIGVDLAAALAQAHELGIVHRDVKPANGFVHRRRDGARVVKLLDFGIAAMLGEWSGTRHGFQGTHRYAAPEQLREEPPTAATDVYALGLVLFEALTLQSPFEPPGTRLGAGALAFAHCNVEPPRISSVRADVPERLDTLIAQCLAKLPADRPAPTAALHHALRHIRSQFERNLVGAPSVEAITEVDSPPAFTATETPLAEAPAVERTDPASTPVPRRGRP